MKQIWITDKRILTLTLILALGVGVGMHFLFPSMEVYVHHFLTLHPVHNVLITLLIAGGGYIYYLLRNKHTVQLENQQLRAESLLNQYEALKSQLNPHMLFNSLNTLRSLIRETPDKAQNYLQELSHVLRYTLQGNESQLVILRDEMEFARAYMYLLKMRYEENLCFEIEIDEASEMCRLPPMSVQLLIENAVKHNEISNRRPLTIRIHADGNSLEVSNPIQPKLTASGGTGIGLPNLSKRYQLLFKEDIAIRRTPETFTVILPLK